MKFIFIFLLMPALLTAQVKEFTVLDAKSKAPVPFANISFLNGFGVFSDANGKVLLQDAGIQKLEISSLGYKSVVIATAALKADVYLEPTSIELQEVIVSKNKKPKAREVVVKPVVHQKVFQMYMSGVGLQYAFHVPFNKDAGYLSDIALPLMEAAFEAEGRPGVFDKILFRTLIKIELLQNDNNMPGEKLNDFEQLAIIDNNSRENKFSIALDEYIEVPETGLFVQLTIIGRTTDSGQLISELPYEVYTTLEGQEGKMIKYCQPNFPLSARPKGVLTFVKYSFDKQPQWAAINKPHLYQLDKAYPDFNIGFGYTTVNK